MRASSITVIATRARVGKPSLYLRWPNHAAILMAAVAEIARPIPPVDEKSLHESLVVALESDHHDLLSGEHVDFLRSLLFESAYDADLAGALWAHVLAPRRDRVVSVLNTHREVSSGRGIGQLTHFADLLQVPLINRMAVRAGPLGRRGTERHVAAVLRGIAEVQTSTKSLR